MLARLELRSHGIFCSQTLTTNPSRIRRDGADHVFVISYPVKTFREPDFYLQDKE